MVASCGRRWHRNVAIRLMSLPDFLSTLTVDTRQCRITSSARCDTSSIVILYCKREGDWPSSTHDAYPICLATERPPADTHRCAIANGHLVMTGRRLVQIARECRYAPHPPDHPHYQCTGQSMRCMSVFPANDRGGSTIDLAHRQAMGCVPTSSSPPGVSGRPEQKTSRH